MNEDAAASLALDAYQALQGIHEDVAQIKGLNSDVLDVLRDLQASEVPDPDLAAVPIPLDDSSNWVTEVRSSVEVPPDFFNHLMGFQYMQTVLIVFMLLALLLNLGAILWLAFSDKWRS